MTKRMLAKYHNITAYEIDYHYGLLGAPLLASDTSGPASKTLFYLGRPASHVRASLIYTLSEKLVLGAVNPKDGSLVWRQNIGAPEIIGNRKKSLASSDKATFLKHSYHRDALVTGAEGTVASWVALSGRLDWTKSINGKIVDLAIAGDVAVLSKNGDGAVVELLDSENGMVKWGYSCSSDGIPVKLVSSPAGIAYVSLQRSKNNLHVSMLDANSGTVKSEYSIATGSDIVSPTTIIYIGDTSAKVVHDFSIDVGGGAPVEKIRVHAPSERGAPSYFLVSYETATSSWADAFQFDAENATLTKLKTLPTTEGKSLFATTAVLDDVFFTRITNSDLTLFSAKRDGQLASWSNSAPSEEATVFAIAEVVPRGPGWSVRLARIHPSGDWSICVNGEHTWTRPESLADVIAAEWASLPIEEAHAHDLDVEGSQSVLEAYIYRVKRHLSDLRGLGDYLRELPLKIATGFLPSDGAELERFDVGKKIIVATKKGRVAAIDTARRGQIAWNNQVANLAAGETWNVKAIKCANGVATIYPDKGGLLEVDVETGAIVNTKEATSEISSLVFLHDNSVIKVDGAGVPYLSSLPETSNSLFLVTRSDDEQRIIGWNTVNRDSPAWAFSPPSTEKIINVVSRVPDEAVASIGSVLGDRSVLYKYLNPNLILVTAAGQSAVSFYLLNGISGQILYSVKHDKVDTSKPIASAISENWFVYSLFSDVSEKSKSKGYQLVINELYESPLKNDRGRLGKAVNYTNIDLPEPHVFTQSYIIAEPISVMSVTQTRQGITTRNLIVYLPESGSIASIPRVLLNARRPVGRDPTPAETEEGLIPYSPYLDIDGRWYLSHARDVWDINRIITKPTMLESTGLVFAFGGLDLFGTRVHPSMAFDVLGKEFNKVQLVLTVVGLAIGVAMLQPMATRKQINQMWMA
ncbi:hypothetical protein KEM54_004444 [Ascosphaera aggregata]|nr:hypothetical protein KEM54_004444 [Ascosphaera aggregata]